MNESAAGVTHTPARPVRRWWYPIWYHLIMTLAYAWFRIACRGRVEGEEHIRVHSGDRQIIAANHVSYLDWMVLHALFYYRYRRKLVFLAKDSLFRHPLWAPLVIESKSVRVSDEGTAILDRQGFRQLRNASAIGMFPEGTRSPTGALGTFHTGVAKLAMRLKIPVVPTTLLGFYESWPRHRRFPRPARCVIRFGSPMAAPTDAEKDPDFAASHSQHIMRRIAEAAI